MEGGQVVAAEIYFYLEKKFTIRFTAFKSPRRNIFTIAQWPRKFKPRSARVS